jgi:hypothetical protein
VAYEKLRGKYDRYKRKNIVEASTSDSSIVHPQVDELTKLVKSLSVEMEKLKLEGKQTPRNTQNALITEVASEDQIILYIILPRDLRNRDMDDQKVQTPLQNNLVVDEEGEDEETDLEIHCLGDTSSSPHLTHSTYEESLMDNQIN